MIFSLDGDDLDDLNRYGQRQNNYRLCARQEHISRLVAVMVRQCRAELNRMFLDLMGEHARMRTCPVCGISTFVPASLAGAWRKLHEHKEADERPVVR